MLPVMRLGLSEAGTGETLVLLHGVGTSRVIWEPAMPLLAATRKVVAVDVPGFGESEPAGPGFDLEEVGGTIAEGLREAGVSEPYDVLGQSMGGALGLILGAHHAGSVRRLIVGAPAGFVDRSAPVADLIAAGTVGYVAARRILGPRLAASATGRRLMFLGAVGDGAKLAPEQVERMIEASGQATRLREAMSAIVTANLRPELRALRAPLGLVWGGMDVTVPMRVAEEIQAIRPGTPLEVIPGAAHIPQVEKPREYAAAVEALLAQPG